MKLKLIGAGVKKDGTRKPFIISDKTTKAGLEDIIREYDKITAVIEPRSHIVAAKVITEPLVRSPEDYEERLIETEGGTRINSTEVFGFDSQRLRNLALTSLLETGKFIMQLGLILTPFDDVIKDSALIQTKLEELKQSLPE